MHCGSETGRPGSPIALFRKTYCLNHGIVAMVLFPTCGKLWGPSSSQGPGIKAPVPQSRYQRSLVPNSLVQGIWDFGGLSVCGDVICVVNVQKPWNFTANSFHKLGKITIMSLRFSISSSVKWE